MARLLELIRNMLQKKGRLARYRKVLSVLMAVVVFCTTYALILPALTLDAESASDDPAIRIEEMAAEEPEEEPDAEEEPEEISEPEEEAEVSDPEEVVSPDPSETPEEDAEEFAEDSSQEIPAEEISAEQLIAAPAKLTFRGEDYTVTAEFDESAHFPEGVELSVKEIRRDVKEEKEAYQAYYDTALEEVQKKQGEQKVFTYARFFDISFVKDENVYEPAAPVSVTITYDQLEKKDERRPEEEAAVSVLHFDNEEPEEILEVEPEVKEEKESLGIAFDAEQFSVYGVVYTLDFHYLSNGETYFFSIPGGGYLTLSQLAEVLGLGKMEISFDAAKENAENLRSRDANFEKNGREESGQTYPVTLNGVRISDATRKFLADVERVEFSDPELVWTGEADGSVTVGELKEENDLAVQYSADLSEAQIAEINESRILSGDWTLISLRPFTSRERITVTMKNGDSWSVEVTDAQIFAQVMTADGADYLITVTYGDDAGIPDGAELHAAEIAQDSAEYARYLEEAKAALGIVEHELVTPEHPWASEVTFARFFDISIWAAGVEIEPLAPVSVEVKYLGAGYANTAGMEVVHFADTGLEVLEASSAPAEDGTAVTFTQSSFSVTGTIINSANLVNDDYYILHEANSRIYALATDGSTADVTDYYDPASLSVSGYSGKNITWEISYGNDQYNNPWYYIKAKGEDKYLTLKNGITGTAEPAFLQAATWSGEKDFWIHNWSQQTTSGWGWSYTDHYHHILNWNSNNNTFSFDRINTHRDGWGGGYYGDQNPTEIRLAKLTGDSEVVNTNYPNNTYNEAQIQAWLDQAMNDKPLQDVSKKASLYDYDNRIYQIDFSAKSGVIAMGSDLSMAFVTDVSNSMLFPAKLTEIDGKKNIYLTSGNLDSLPHNNGEVYFTIADGKESSTVYAIYYRNNGWKAMDASYYARWKAGVKQVGDDNNYDYVGKREKSIGSGAAKLHDNDTSYLYTIYTGNEEWFQGIANHEIYNMDSGNMGNRLYYLESSVAGAVDDMKTIAREYPLGAVYAGLETFAKTVQSTGTYMQIGGYAQNMGNANQKYDANAAKIFDELKNLKGYDGTNQEAAFKEVPSFKVDGNTNLPSGTNKYVIMITDGAPNYSDTGSNHAKSAIAAANKLKQAGYTVITIGLSTKDVQVAPEMLWKSASFVDPTVSITSEDKSKAKYYYYAEDGNDLKWILRDLVRSLMKQASVTSTITDKIDPLFYPVDKDGIPFDQNSVSYIKQDGTRCSANDPEKYAKVEYTNGEWTVTWENQDIPWEGWNSSLYVKAHEDFLGGNTISTNKEASFVPESYTTNKGQSDERTGYFTEAQKEEKTETPATPYVNVDELKITQNSTAQILYLGEESTPAEDVEKLWDALVVNTVVHQDGMKEDYTIESRDNMYYDPGRSNRLTADNNPLNAAKDPVTEIPLSHYIDKSVFTDLLEQLKDGSTRTSVTSEPIDYAPYGQGKVGTLTMKLEKQVNEEAKDDAPEQHTTKKTGSPVETYTLTVEYTPLPGSSDDADVQSRKELLIADGAIDADDQGYMNNGDNGPGKEVNEADSEVKSTNEHKIYVYAKSLQITKTNADFLKKLSGAKFELYRTARTGETGAQDLPGASGKYVKVSDLEETSESVFVKNELEILKPGEKYYLVEAEGPDGYLKLDHPVEVKLELKTEYYPVNTSERNMRDNEGTDAPEGTLYCLAEKSKLTLADDAAVRRTLADGTDDLTHEGMDLDAETMTMYYSIANNPGAELPAAGGPGTALYTGLGALLILVAGILLEMRRRRSCF